MRKWLKDSRIEKGFTMKELGTKLGISESYYSAIEAGIRQKNMDLTLVAALSSVLEIPIADIVKYEAADANVPVS